MSLRSWASKQRPLTSLLFALYLAIFIALVEGLESLTRYEGDAIHRVLMVTGALGYVTRVTIEYARKSVDVDREGTE